MVADKGYRDGKDLMNCLVNGIIPNVFPKDGVIHIDLETEYKASEISEEKKACRNPKDIKECLRAGLIPDIYKDIVTDIEVLEKTTYEKKESTTEEEILGMTEEKMIAKAKEGYQKLADDLEAPQGARARATEVLRTLGK